MSKDDDENKKVLFRELLERNYPRWMGIARAYAAAAAADAREDLMQEISLQVWKSLDRFAGRAHIDTWAYRVAINTALAWKRSARSRKRFFFGGSNNTEKVDVADLGTREGSGGGGMGGGGAADASRADEKRVLEEFLASLSGVDRAAMLLYLDDVPPAEAAEILGVAEGALRVRMHRIRKRFEATYCDPERDPRERGGET